MRNLTLLLLTLSLMCVPLSAAKKKTQTNSQDPYATAELDTLPAVTADDLAYRTILFDDFVVPSSGRRMPENW